MASDKSKGDKLALSQRDLQLMAMAWQCLKSEPQIDMGKLAELAGYKNETTARVCFNPVKKKLLAASGIETSSPGGGGATKRKAPAQTVAKGDGGDAEETEATPTKKPRGGKTATAAARGGKGGGRGGKKGGSAKVEKGQSELDYDDIDDDLKAEYKQMVKLEYQNGLEDGET